MENSNKHISRDPIEPFLSELNLIPDCERNDFAQFQEYINSILSQPVDESAGQRTPLWDYQRSLRFTASLVGKLLGHRWTQRKRFPR